MAVINGTAINFGFKTSGGITITGISGVLLQSADLSVEADVADVRSALGDIVARAWYDQHSVATIEWEVSGTDLAAAITNSTLASVEPGDIIIITACASRPELIATNWECQSGSKIAGSNTANARISVTVHKRAGITGTVGTITT